MICMHQRDCNVQKLRDNDDDDGNNNNNVYCYVIGLNLFQFRQMQKCNCCYNNTDKNLIFISPSF
jgi:hypothetical protein